MFRLTEAEFEEVFGHGHWLLHLFVSRCGAVGCAVGRREGVGRDASRSTDGVGGRGGGGRSGHDDDVVVVVESWLGG